MRKSKKIFQACANKLGRKSKGSGIDKSNTNKRPTKRQHILGWLVDKSLSGARVTRFDSERVGDHCLPTTISELQSLEGIAVSREMTKRPTRFGKPISCAQYWLDRENIGKAQKLLAHQLGGDS